MMYELQPWRLYLTTKKFMACLKVFCRKFEFSFKYWIYFTLLFFNVRSTCRNHFTFCNLFWKYVTTLPTDVLSTWSDKMIEVCSHSQSEGNFSSLSVNWWNILSLFAWGGWTARFRNRAVWRGTLVLINTGRLSRAVKSRRMGLHISIHTKPLDSRFMKS